MVSELDQQAEQLQAILRKRGVVGTLELLACVGAQCSELPGMGDPGAVIGWKAFIGAMNRARAACWAYRGRI